MKDVYQKFLALLKRYGREINLHKGESIHRFKAYIAPFDYRNRQYFDDTYSILGYRDQNAFLYIGSPENGGDMLCVGDVIYWDNEGFLVSVCEKRHVGEQLFYIWAVLKRANEEGIV